MLAVAHRCAQNTHYFCMVACLTETKCKPLHPQCFIKPCTPIMRQARGLTTKSCKYTTRRHLGITPCAASASEVGVFFLHTLHVTPYTYSIRTVYHSANFYNIHPSSCVQYKPILSTRPPHPSPLNKTKSWMPSATSSTLILVRIS